MAPDYNLYLSYSPKKPEIGILAAIEVERLTHQTLLVISILALLIIAGAVFADRMLINEQGTEQAAN